MEREIKTVLNVGGSNKFIEIPGIYAGWRHLILDIADGEQVDIVMDARDMDIEHEHDAVYLSHTLEHFASKDIQLVLSNFRKALKIGGHIYIVVPNFGYVVKSMAENGMDLQQPLYEAESGPVTAQDIIFGSPRDISRDHEEFMIHRTGFTKESLKRELEAAGFDLITIEENNFEITAIGWVSEEDPGIRRVIASPVVSESSVIIGFAHNGFIRNEFYQSLRAVQNYDAANSKHIKFEISAGGAYIAQNRNLICEQALKTSAEWLWMLDTDVVFPGDMLDRMLEVADPIERPILGAVYFTPLEERWCPVWLETIEDKDYPVQALKIGEVRDLAVVGMGCTLIHRSVLEGMAKTNSEDPWPWFGHDIIKGTRTGEDVTFCYRAKNAGFKTSGFAYPLVHMKTYPVDWKIFHDQYRLMELDMKDNLTS